MKTEPVGLLLDSTYLRHDTGPGHPECSARYEAIQNAILSRPEFSDLAAIKARKATVEELTRCHAPSYIEKARKEVQAGHESLSTGDTQVCECSYEVAQLAAGGVIAAVDAVMAGELKRAFCAVRPPGHHARPAQGMGFCLFNNIAIGARHAQKRWQAQKVAIVDWDVHHGNGTQDIFYEDGSVLFASMHQSPWYPFTGSAEERGEGAGEGTTLNFPMPAGSGRAAFQACFEDHLIPAMDAFQPDLLLISAGFDSREGDPLGRFRLRDEDFQWMTRELRSLALRHCEGRLISVLEGGYDLEGLASGVSAHLAALVEI